MQTKNKYEEMIFREIQEMPKSMLPRILKILQILRESMPAPESFRKNKSGSTGLCGIWQDDRSADEIIRDIYTHRTGLGDREIKL